jgi:drug/metabolite transporter (DMT)-like permease
VATVIVPTAALLSVSVLWGTTFVAIKSGLADASPLLFVGLRFALAALAASVLVRGRRIDRAAILRGIPLGIVAASAYATQTLGLASTTPARSAFITGLNVALVPFWGMLLLRRRPGRLPLFGLLISLPGLWLLTTPGGAGWNPGDTWTLACAILFALHLVLISRAGAKYDIAWLLISQLAVTAALALAASAALEEVRLAPTPRLLGCVALTALLATTGTTWLQLRFQPRLDPTRVAVIYATEPVFAAILSRIFFGEVLTAVGWVGGGLILAGMVLAESAGISRASRRWPRRSAAGPSRLPHE